MRLHHYVSFHVSSKHLDQLCRNYKLYRSWASRQYVAFGESAQNSFQKFKWKHKIIIIFWLEMSNLTSHVDFRADLYPHTLQMNGLIRLCTALMCFDNVLDVANTFEQMSQVFLEYHRDGRSLSICDVVTWCRNCVNCSKDIGHDEHRKPFNCSCTWRCRKIFTN